MGHRRDRQEGLRLGAVAAAGRLQSLLADFSILWALLRGRGEDLLPERLDLLLQEVELELGGDTFTTKLGDLDLELGDGLLLGNDGLLEEDGGLLQRVNVPDLLQPWHAQ